METTAILIHGCHLYAQGWENIVWGNPRGGIYGRAAKGLLLAERLRPVRIFWGTGASEKDGVREAEYTLRYALEHIKELFPEYFETHGDRFGVKEWITKCSSIDVESQTTPQEVKRAMIACISQKIKKLILVSSPTHIPRCLQSAEVVRAEGGFEGLEIFATASDTCFANSTAKDVLIVEPPHRGDRPDVPIHKTLRRAMRIGRGPKAGDFNTALESLLNEWEKVG